MNFILCADAGEILSTNPIFAEGFGTNDPSRHQYDQAPLAAGMWTSRSCSGPVMIRMISPFQR